MIDILNEKFEEKENNKYKWSRIYMIIISDLGFRSGSRIPPKSWEFKIQYKLKSKRFLELYNRININEIKIVRAPLCTEMSPTVFHTYHHIYTWSWDPDPHSCSTCMTEIPILCNFVIIYFLCFTSVTWASKCDRPCPPCPLFVCFCVVYTLHNFLHHYPYVCIKITLNFGTSVL